MLDEIIKSKHDEVARAQKALSLEDLQARLASHQTERSFRNAIITPDTLSLIAELKRKSPSKGMLRERFDPVSLAQTLQEAGASALSVLTDEPYFGGQLEFLRDVKQFTEVPVLRKDFLVDVYQVYEAAAHEADAVLLIVCILEEKRLIECLQVAETLGLDALVEVHSEGELTVALRNGASIIGVNHRDLKTLTMDLTVTERLVPQIPSGKVIVAESGLHTAEDIAKMQALGVHGVLIGEALMTAADPAAKITELFRDVW